jgi:hypothetical protein
MAKMNLYSRGDRAFVILNMVLIGVFDLDVVRLHSSPSGLGWGVLLTGEPALRATGSVVSGRWFERNAAVCRR